MIEIHVVIILFCFNDEEYTNSSYMCVENTKTYFKKMKLGRGQYFKGRFSTHKKKVIFPDSSSMEQTGEK